MVQPLEQRRIGKYEVLAPLSQGGMAEVFLAYLPGPGGFRKFVAVKQILPQERQDDSFVKLFLDEARITAALTHPNIGQVFELGRDETTQELFLAMEFIAGQTLSAVLSAVSKAGEKLAPEVACRLARDACLALHAAHSFVDPSGRPLPIVHRDVSPKNVMLSYDGHVKVIDFGIAKARGRLSRTDAGLVRGTISYMSPEQLFDEPLDGRSDQFSMGIVLHELLTARHLYSSGPKAAMEIAEDAAQPPSAINPAVSPALDAVVLKALSKEKTARFESCKAMARAIEAACPRLANEDELAAVLKRHFEKQLDASRKLLLAAGTATGVTQELSGLAAQAHVSLPRVVTAETRPRAPAAAQRDVTQPEVTQPLSSRAIAVAAASALALAVALTVVLMPRETPLPVQGPDQPMPLAVNATKPVVRAPPVVPPFDPLPDALQRARECVAGDRASLGPAAGTLAIMLDVSPAGDASPLLDEAWPQRLKLCLRSALSFRYATTTAAAWKQPIQVEYAADEGAESMGAREIAEWKERKGVTRTLEDMRAVMRQDRDRKELFGKVVKRIESLCQIASTQRGLDNCEDELTKLSLKFYKTD